MTYADAYSADRSLKGKIRRRVVRLAHRRPMGVDPGRPMVSFTFDDAPATAAIVGAHALESRGVRGTYYVAAGLAGALEPMGVCAEAADYQRLNAAGHEIACHTYSHLDCGQATGARASADVDANAETLRAWGAPAPVTFAYPYGDVGFGPKQALGGRFKLLRALHHGVMVKGSDLNQAPAVGIEGPGGEALARRWISIAHQRRAWLILYTHDVREDPSPWGCTPEALGRLIDAALAEGFEVTPVAEAARKLAL